MTSSGVNTGNFRTYLGGCVAIEVRLPSGDISIGTGFHVGDGVFLTARHVLEGNTIKAILAKAPCVLTTPDEIAAGLTLMGEPVFHSDPDVDVAAFRVGDLKPDTPILELGGHYDDYINDEQWLLSEGVVFGYPPIPSANDAILVVDRVTLNAVVDTYRDRYVRFVVSGVPRGGFSGGPVYHEWGFVLGMITESLEYQGEASSSGYLTVLSIEALRECLEHHDMLPACQALELND